MTSCKFKKLLTLAQEYGIDLGYEFAWNRRGPYCKQVSEHAHVVLNSDVDNDIDLINEKEKLQEFAKIMKLYLNDTDWLEIAASLMYLRRDSYEGKALDQIIVYLIEDLTYGYKNFNETLVRKVIFQMSKNGIFTQ